MSGMGCRLGCVPGSALAFVLESALVFVELLPSWSADPTLLPLVSAGTPHTVPRHHGHTATPQTDLHVVVVVVVAGNHSYHTPVAAAGGGQGRKRVAVRTEEWGSY